MKKGIRCLLVAAVAVAIGGKGIARGDVGDEFEAGGLRYKVLSEEGAQGTVEVGSENDAAGEVVIPASVENGGIEYQVTGIGGRAFMGCNAMTGVTIPAGVTNIGPLAFYMCSLHTVSIPVGVVSVGDSIFGSCFALGTFQAPSFLEGKVEWSRGTPEYYDAQLVSFDANGGECERTRKGVMRGEEMTYGALPSATWEGHAFLGWFTEAEDGDRVRAESGVSDGNERTLYAHWLEASSGTDVVDDVTWTYAVEEDGTGVTVVDASGVSSHVIIPDALGGLPVTGLGDKLFSMHPMLFHVRIPASVVRVGNDVFRGDSPMLEIQAPSFLRGTDWGFFGGHEEFFDAQRVTFDARGGTCAPSQKGVECRSDKAYGALSEAAWEWHTFLGWFTAADGGEQVTPESQVEGEDERTLYAHWREGAAETVDGVTWFFAPDESGSGMMVKGADPAEGALVIPGALRDFPVTGIGDGAFSGCVGLTGLTIPVSVVGVGSNVFEGCDALGDVAAPSFLEGEADWGNGTPAYYPAQRVTFDANGGRCAVPRKGVERGAGAKYGALPEPVMEWHTFLGWFSATNGGEAVTADSVVSDENERTLHAQWRNGASETVGEVSWSYLLDESGEGLTVVGAEPAEGDLEMPETLAGLPVTGIGTNAFQLCKSLTGMTIPSGVRRIGAYAFWLCESLAAVSIPDGVTSIGEEAFEGCALPEVTLPAGLTDIGYRLFGSCGALTNVTIPYGVTNIGLEAFFECGALAGVRIPASVLSVGKDVFFGCDNLGDFQVPNFLEGKVEEWGGGNPTYYPAQLVTFDGNGGTSLVPQKGVERGEGMTYGTLPGAERPGRTCVGWFSAAEGGDEVMAETGVSDEDARTLYAHWREGGEETVDGATWTYALNADGLSVTLTALTGASGMMTMPGTLGQLPVTAIGDGAFSGNNEMTRMTIPPSVLEVGERVFEGCNRLELFWAPDFLEEKPVVWGANDAWYYPAQLVTFDAGGGTCVPAQKGVERGEGETYGALPVNVEREGWRFAGWFSEADGGDEVTAESAVTDEGKRTLYAHWTSLVTGVTARQRWPWNGLVDIDYELLEGMPAEGVEVEITVEDPEGGKSWVAQTFLKGAEPSSAVGRHRATWDAAADGADEVVSSNAVATVALVRFSPETLYRVIDLSGGRQAATYPVSFLAEVPEGGWGDAYKTTKLALRRVSRGDWNNGAFQMGGDTATTLSKPYYIGVFPVTQRQWEQVAGTKPSYFERKDCYAARPVEQVTYNAIRGANAGARWPADHAVDGSSFLGLLRSKTSLGTLDLPTEAQWEFACRAGAASDFNSGKDATNAVQDAAMDEVGRYVYNGGTNYNQTCGTDGGTAAVGSYAANAWGLYDMHGNVWEWCLDWWAESLVGGEEPAGPESGEKRVMRGGAWNYFAGECTSSARRGNVPSGSDFGGGFRLAWTPAPGEVPSSNVTFGVSAPFRLDTRSGPRESTGEESLAYSALWAGGDAAIVTLAEDGTPFAEALDGEGEQAWRTDYNGTYTLTHTTVSGGVTGAVETAEFIVSGKAERPQTVKFDANGGTCEVKTKQYVRGGTYEELPTPEWAHHQWLGWFTAKEGGKQVITNSTVTTNLTRTLHAHWQEQTPQELYEAWLDDLGLADAEDVGYPNRDNDADQDGMSNWQEYLADTHPKDSNVFFHLTATLDESGAVLLTSPAFTPTRHYALMTYTNLISPPSEKELGPGTPGMVLTNHPDATQFWRLKVGVE